MYSFKSSPLLTEQSKPTRKRGRTSKRGIKAEEYYAVPNPFRVGEQQNYLPGQLMQQIQQLDYISPHHIQQMQLAPGERRRSSAFARQLQKMQHAAQKQQEMCEFFAGMKIGSNGNEDTQMVAQNQHPLTIEEGDEVSLGREQCLWGLEDPMEHELSFLEQPEQQLQMGYFSQHLIGEEPNLGQDFDSYFDV